GNTASPAAGLGHAGTLRQRTGWGRRVAHDGRQPGDTTRAPCGKLRAIRDRLFTAERKWLRRPAPRISDAAARHGQGKKLVCGVLHDAKEPLSQHAGRLEGGEY